MLCRLTIEPPSGMPSKNEANPLPPGTPEVLSFGAVNSIGAAGLEVNSVPKFMEPRDAEGWKMVNCSSLTSAPNFNACRPATFVKLSVNTQLFCFSIDGRKPELPMPTEEPSLNVILGRPPLSGANGTPGKPSWLATLRFELI